jgi:hypothetical protein
VERIVVVGLEAAQEAVADAARTVHFSGKVECIPAIAEIFSADISEGPDARAVRHNVRNNGESKNDVRPGRQVASKPHPVEG